MAVPVVAGGAVSLFSQAPRLASLWSKIAPHVGTVAAYLAADRAIDQGAGMVDSLVERTGEKFTADNLKEDVDTYVKGDPAAGSIVLSTIAEQIGEGSLDLLMDYIQNRMGRLHSQVNSSDLKEVLKSLVHVENTRQEKVGDGDPSTIWGDKPSDVMDMFAKHKVGIEKVDFLRRVFLSREVARKVYEYIHEVEDKHFDLHEMYYPDKS